MTIGVAMSTYFQRLKELYKKQFGTAPTFPWEENAPHKLFISPPDEDGDAQWAPKLATPLPAAVADALCSEMVQYYSSWYFLQLRGRIKNIDLDFLPFFSQETAIRAAKTALADGRDYFPAERCVLLATCTVSGVDDMLLFYDQSNGKLFVYDPDKKVKHSVNASLPQLLADMEALL